MLPLLTYQKIYYDAFSNPQWEKHKAYAYNVDYWPGTGVTGLVTDMIQLRYANYPKDYFMGMLPSSQYGGVAVLPSSYSPSYHASSVIVRDASSPDALTSRIANSASSSSLSTFNTLSSERVAFVNSDLSALSIIS